MDSNAKIKIIISLILCTASFCLLAVNKIMWAQIPLETKLKGKILLQVEKHGEAWYVNPVDRKRYYLGRPADAFNLMKELSVGITNDDLIKIPLAEVNFSGPDADKDGLPDAIEESLGTDKNKTDTDNDGYNDKTEILNNFNPSGAGKLAIDRQKIENLAGMIVLQVEKNGEAWYINPDNLKRYYLGRPADAFNLMRQLGLGISNKNIAQISSYQINKNYTNVNIIKKYTTPLGNTQREYIDPINRYSFVYPAGWTIKKFEDLPNSVQITDAVKDFIIEKKAAITLNYFKSDKNFSDMKIFRIAGKGKSTTLTDEEKTINNYDAYENSYEHDLAYEKTTTIKINPREFLQISLVTAKRSNDYYLSIYNNLLHSLKLASTTCSACQ